jgi:hypothetical protein
MKKLILALALMVTFAACSGPATEATAPVADSTAVAVDTAACCADSTAVDTCVAK